MSGLTTDIYFLTVLKAGNPRSASDEGPLPGLRMTASSLCPHGVESSLVSFRIRALITLDQRTDPYDLTVP